jgi:DNA polymerase II large subunit
MGEGIWPVTVAGWVALIVSVTLFLGGIVAYFKGWVIFRHSIDERFKAINKRLDLHIKDIDDRLDRNSAEFTKSVERIVDDVIGLPRNVSVKGELNGIGRRIDQADAEDEQRDLIRREKLSEFFQAQSKIRDMENEIKNLAVRIAELREASNLTLAELRALTRDTGTRLEEVNTKLTVISTEFKHIQRQAAS